MTKDEEKGYIERVLAGDESAYEPLVTENQTKVYRLALRILKNEADAEDAAQEAFLKAYTSLADFRGDSRFSVWLYRLTNNICIDMLRKNKRAVIVSLQTDDDGEETELAIPDERYSPERLAERAADRDAVRSALASLPDDCREILALRESAGLSYDEIAAGAEESARPEKYYEPPLVNILKFACNACPEKRYIVTNLCQNCLAHPCREICPKKAVKLSHRGVSRIQEDLCIRCGKCANVCPYNAIILQERPCAKACGMDAIRSDEHGRADIDYDKCVSCGMCLVNCPFGAISDKSQLFQLTQALRGGEKVIAIVAPAFVGQLGPNMTPDKLKAAMKMLGFRHVAEVAVGADLCTLDEAKDFLEKVPAEQPFMATSCCPSWAVMAKKLFPEQANCISMALTPMVLTARLCKQQHPGEKVAFIGPCSAKKLEAMRTTVRSEVDFVLTFEEVMGMFEAKGINFNEITQTAPLREGTAAGRGFAVSGGVAEAVREAISHIDPDREVKTACAQGLKDCRKMLTLAKAGKYDGYLLEGMACPGGCVAGAGTLLPIEKAAAIVRNYTAQAEEKSATETKYEATLPLLLEDEEDAE